MLLRKIYKVADHLFAVNANEALLAQMTQYEPFLVEQADGPLVFELTVVADEPFPATDITVETSQDDDGSQIVAGHTADGLSYFEYLLWGDRSARVLASPDYRQTRVWTESHELFGVNNALMVMFALATADKGTALFHSAIVGHEGHGYMFLGKSGTGKSTHARLWMRYISGTELVNDDNPVVRVFPDGAVVYGSPWSGKTPCYRNMSLPLGGIVLLSQAPYNKIERLRSIAAYAAIVPSISGKRWDTAVADGLHDTENQLAMHVPVWHLDCLPDEAAARLCQETIENSISV
jgi:hypothetical protein